jgi:hypothetical protein
VYLVEEVYWVVLYRHEKQIQLLSLFGVGLVDQFLSWQFNILCSFADIGKQRSLASLQVPCSIQLFLSLSVTMEMATVYIDTLEL